jgi:hypothetical protein
MLGETQLALQNRFAHLAANRRELNYPVYALEHGLEASQLAALRSSASQWLRWHSPSSQQWLVWAILGAEAGYGYSGDEYWPALEVAPGDWRSNEHRQALRQFYRRFQSEFNGPTPTGRWAEHFSIIAWPITHAILPRYLQTYFARHIWHHRFELAHKIAGASHGLGQFLLDKYDGPPSRFRDFLQQTELTAQIVLALRDEDLREHVPRIDPLLLNRIVSDLETHHDARSYLRETRKLIHSVSIKLSSRLQADTVGGGFEPSPSAATAIQRPRLAARRQADGGFLLGLQLPDIDAALKTGGLNAGALAGCRVRFVGPDERYVPASNLLSLSKKERRLDAFPAPYSPIFTIENGATGLNQILEPLSKLEERPCWVLRRESNGLYKEVLGSHIRTGQKYLILTRGHIPHDVAERAGITPTPISAAEVKAYKLSTSTLLDNAQKSALEELGICTVTSVRIDAVGLNPRPSLADEPPTWLSTESVTLRLKADFEAEAFLVGLDGGSHQKCPCVGGELLIQFDQLEPGRHSVSVSIWQRGAGSKRTETFAFQVSVPRPWIGAMREKAGFRLLLEPPSPKIEHVFDGHSQLQILGPAGRNVQWSLETYDAAGHFFASHPLGIVKVGVAHATLQSILARGRNEHAVALDEAYRIDIVAGLEELGRQALSFPHEVEPLRWKFDLRTGVARLIDETDHAEPLSVYEYPLEAPIDRRKIDAQAALSGYAVRSPGSLLVASYMKRRVSLVASLPSAIRLRDLTELGLAQTVSLPEMPSMAMIRLIDSLRRWERAKAVGYLGPVRKVTTTDRLRSEISTLACGSDFVHDLKSSQLNGKERAQKKVGGSPGFGSRMRTHAWPGALSDAQRPFAEFASTYGVDKDGSWCRAALTLAYSPLSLRVPEGADKQAYIGELLSKRILLRGAFLAHATSQNISTDVRAIA